MKVRVGVAGLGTIGTGVVHLLQNNGSIITGKSKVALEVAAVADLDLERQRDIDLGGIKKYNDALDMAEDQEIDVLVELVGGVDFPLKLVRKALENGKHVVTANKALIAKAGQEIYALAAEKGLALGIEASVAGGIPIIKAIRESLAGNRVQEIRGIINGTSNYILTRMGEEGMSFESALAKAQELGFAEAESSLDVNGGDAAHKIAILAALAFNTPVDLSAVPVEGIESLELQDIIYASELGYIVKLIGIARDRGELGVEARVHPMLVPETDQLAGIRNEFNAVFIRSDYLGDAMFTGRGAGAFPTASAVVGDLADIGVKMRDHVRIGPFFSSDEVRPFVAFGETVNKYYLRFHTVDEAGILSQIAGTLGKRDISIASVIQKESAAEGGVPVVMITHEAREADIREALKEIEAFPFIKGQTVFMRAL